MASDFQKDLVGGGPKPPNSLAFVGNKGILTYRTSLFEGAKPSPWKTELVILHPSDGSDQYATRSYSREAPSWLLVTPQTGAVILVISSPATLSAKIETLSKDNSTSSADLDLLEEQTFMRLSLSPADGGSCLDFICETEAELSSWCTAFGHPNLFGRSPSPIRDLSDAYNTTQLTIPEVKVISDPIISLPAHAFANIAAAMTEPTFDKHPTCSKVILKIDARGTAGRHGLTGSQGKTGNQGAAGDHGRDRGGKGVGFFRRDGRPGKDGGMGGPGSKGENGSEGETGSPGKQVVLALARSGSTLCIRGSAQADIRLALEKDTGLVLLDARGGLGGFGGNGGIGGQGGIGGRGGDGEDAPKGTAGVGGQGGTGGQGGDGGNGGNGGDGGLGGQVFIQSSDPLLFALIESDVRGGDPGNGGEGGLAGLGGLGGPGGNGGIGKSGRKGSIASQTSTSFGNNPNARAPIHAPNGFPGVEGTPGQLGQAGTLGTIGTPGSVTYILLDPFTGLPLQTSAVKFNLSIISVELAPPAGRSYLEPFSEFCVSSITIVNKGGISSPSEFALEFLDAPGIVFDSGFRTVIVGFPIAPGETRTVTECRARGMITTTPAIGALGLDSEETEIEAACFGNVLGRPMRQTHFKAPFKVRWPIRLESAIVPRQMGKGDIAKLSITILNESAGPVGSEKKKVILRLLLDKGITILSPWREALVGDSSNANLFASTRSSSSMNSIDYIGASGSDRYGTLSSISSSKLSTMVTGPFETRGFTVIPGPTDASTGIQQVDLYVDCVPGGRSYTVEVAMLCSGKIELLDHYKFECSLLINESPIQKFSKLIRLAPVWNNKIYAKDSLLITSAALSHRCFMAWERLLDIVMLGVDLWDVDREAALSGRSIDADCHATPFAFSSKYKGGLLMFPSAISGVLTPRDILDMLTSGDETGLVLGNGDGRRILASLYGAVQNLDLDNLNSAAKKSGGNSRKNFYKEIIQLLTAVEQDDPTRPCAITHRDPMGQTMTIRRLPVPRTARIIVLPNVQDPTFDGFLSQETPKAFSGMESYSALIGLAAALPFSKKIDAFLALVPGSSHLPAARMPIVSLDSKDEIDLADLLLFAIERDILAEIAMNPSASKKRMSMLVDSVLARPTFRATKFAAFRVWFIISRISSLLSSPEWPGTLLHPPNPSAHQNADDLSSAFARTYRTPASRNEITTKFMAGVASPVARSLFPDACAVLTKAFNSNNIKANLSSALADPTINAINKSVLEKTSLSDSVLLATQIGASSGKNDSNLPNRKRICEVMRKAITVSAATASTSHSRLANLTSLSEYSAEMNSSSGRTLVQTTFDQLAFEAGIERPFEWGMVDLHDLEVVTA